MRIFRKGQGRIQLMAVVVLAAVVSMGAWGTPAIASHLTVRSSDIVNGGVKTPDLGRDSVTTSKLHGSAVTGSKVKDGSLGGKDLLPRAFGLLQAAAMVMADGTVTTQFNRLGGAVTVAHTGTGDYTVTIPGATGLWTEKIVGVSATNSLAECKPWSGTGPTVNVVCRRSSDAAPFNAIFSIWLIR